MPRPLDFMRRRSNSSPRMRKRINNLGSALCHLARFTRSGAVLSRVHGNKAELSRSVCQSWELAAITKANSSAPKGRCGAPLSYCRTYTDARINLGSTLIFLGRLREARACFAKALKTAPRNVHALYGMAQIAAFEGRFDDAESAFRRIIEIDPKMPRAWAALAATRKMTNADSEWLKSAEGIAIERYRSLGRGEFALRHG